MIGQRCILSILLLMYVASVYCKRKYKEGDVKLVGGNKKYMGTVLVRYNNRWGAICDKGWDKKDAHTVCNQLGYYAAASAPTGSKFGIGRKRMFVFRLGCTGKESSIKECPLTSFSRFWRKRCPGEKRTAGVVCYPARRRGFRASRKSRRKTKKQKSNRRKATVRSLEQPRSITVSVSKSTIASTAIATPASTPSSKTRSTLPSRTSRLATTHTSTSSSSSSSSPSTSTSTSTSTFTSTSTSTPTSTSTSASTSTSTLATTQKSTSTPTATATPTSTSTRTPTSTSTPTQTSTSALKPTSTSTSALRPTSTSTSALKPTSTSALKPTSTSTSALKPTSTSTSALKPTSTSTSALKPTSTSTSALKPTSTSTSALKPTSTSTSALKSTPTSTSFFTSVSTSAPTHSSTSALTSPSTSNAPSTTSTLEPTPSPQQSVTVSQTTSSTNSNVETELTSVSQHKPGATNTPEIGETTTAINTKENITVSPDEASSAPLGMGNGDGYNQYAAGVKSDSPDASVDFPVPFNMVSDNAVDKKDSFPGKEKYVKKETEVLLADAPKKQRVNLKLVGGRYDNEGYIRVKVNDGKWATVCSDHWTIREAMVACNQLGNLGHAKQAVTVNFYGGQDENRDIYRIQCVGKETNLSACNLTRADDVHVCSKRRAVAGIVCSKQLPDLIPNLEALQQTMRLDDQPLYYLRCSMEENCLSSSAYVIRNTSRYWRTQYRRLMRFSTIVRNGGTADFRPFQQRSLWQWHACHMHYHSMEVFAHYDIMDAAGNRLAEGSKASFCLEDTVCDDGISPRFNCRGYGEQGLSVNCSDNYSYNIDCQWIDVTDIKPGYYTFLMEINPDLKVAESNFDNNVVSCNLHYSAYNARLRNCHFQSLLDYRRPQKLPA